VNTARYGNWVSMRLVAAPAILGVLLALSAVFIPWLGVPAGLFVVVSAYFVYARWAFSPGGRDIQNRMLALVPQHLSSWDGEGNVLDIGCGSGALAIRVAKSHLDTRVFGVDMWGANWESSKGRCELNARTEGVTERVSFESADAASLPFESESFDAVVSNFVFHEVHGVRDKRKLLEEALRVLRPGGTFVFQDLFLWKRIYGPIDELQEAVRGFGVQTVTFVDTSQSDFIPKLLKLPFMIGTAGILYGRK